MSSFTDYTSPYTRRVPPQLIPNLCDIDNSLAWALSLQGLLTYYHANEGTGTVTNDVNPNGTPSNGTMTNGTWVSGPVTSVLQFAGNGKIDCGATPNFSGLSKITIAGFYDITAQTGYLAYKGGQFTIEPYANASIRFGVSIGGTFYYAVSPVNSAPLNSRLFVACVYDGSFLYIYINQNIYVSLAQTGNLDAGTGDILFAYNFTGVTSELSLWTRALSAQECSELYFFPLLRLTATAKPYTPILSRFNVNLNTQLVINDSNVHVVGFDHTNFDTLDEYDLTNHWFTPQNTGVYLLTAMVCCDMIANDTITFDINDQTTGGNPIITYKKEALTAIATETLYAQGILFLTAGHHYQVTIRHGTAGTTFNVYANFPTNFSGHILSNGTP